MLRYKKKKGLSEKERQKYEETDWSSALSAAQGDQVITQFVDHNSGYNTEARYDIRDKKKKRDLKYIVNKSTQLIPYKKDINQHYVMQLYLTSKFNLVAKPIIQKLKKLKIEKVLVIPTAAEPEKGDLSWLEDDKNVFKQEGFNVGEFTITNKTQAEVQKALKDCDAIFVTGGNSFYLLQELKRNSAEIEIKKAVAGGKPYIGSSAGSVVAGESLDVAKHADKEEEAPDLNDHHGMGMVDISILPHWGSQKEGRKERKLEALRLLYNADVKLLLLRDNQYVDVEGKVWSVGSV